MLGKMLAIMIPKSSVSQEVARFDSCIEVNNKSVYAHLACAADHLH